MPKKHHEPGTKKPRKKSPPTKRQTLVKVPFRAVVTFQFCSSAHQDLRAEKKKLTAALRLVCRDLRSFGIGKKRAPRE